MIDQGGLSSLAPTTPAAVTLTRLHALDMEVILETSLVYNRQDHCCDRSRGIVQPGTHDCCGDHSLTTAGQVSYIKYTDRVQRDLDPKIRC
jgi:hypothetical protein